jgi:RHS repeat-associated protein
LTSFYAGVSPNPSTYGSSVLFSATNQYPGASGTVTFSDGSTTLATVSMANQSASYSTSTLSLGNHSITASFSSSSYPPATASAGTLVVNMAPQVINFTAPSSPVTYGVSPIALAATGGGSGNAVTFSVASGPGSISGSTLTIMGAGTVIVAANQAGNTNYFAATQVQQTVVVNKAMPTISSWPTASAITYGQTLASSGLPGGAASVGGSFAWTTPTTVPGAGSPSESVTFTPSDTTDYNPVLATVTLTVNKVTPTISWAEPAAITYPAAFTGLPTPTANVPGTFTYSSLPPIGTILTPTTATFTATFAPTDATDYAPATATVQLVVNKAVLTVTANSISRVYGATNPTFTAAITGFVNGDTQSNTVSGAPSLSSSAVSTSQAGTYTINVGTGTLSSSYYTFNPVNGTLTITPVTPTISWAPPSAITYGTALSATQLNATASVAGAFAYSPASGTVPGVGTQTLSVTFTPADTTDYNSVTATVTLTISKATPTLNITWSPTSPTHYHLVTFTCSASFLGQPVINGTVLTFLVDGSSVALVSSTSGSSTWSTSSLSVGQHTISCSSGDSTYNVVQASQTFTIYSTVDRGVITLTVNGIASSSAIYGPGSTPETIAASLVSDVTTGSPVTLSEVDGNLYMEAKATGSASNYSYTLLATNYDSADFSQPSFQGSPGSSNLEGGADANSSGGTVYSYSIPSYVASQSPAGYDAVGNVVGYSDQMMGATGLSSDAWGFGYDTLNRLTGAAGSWTGQTGQTNTNYCWGYDAFGNRNLNYSGPCTSGLPLTSYTTNNQLHNGLVQYDPAGTGDLTYDSVAGNRYLYDADGRICAVQSTPVTGYTTRTGYIYNAEGVRVAKGFITTMSCDPTSNGFQTISEYVVGPGGEQLTEVGSDGKGNMIWAHTNVFAAGSLMATYDVDGQHFLLNDWLGNRRAQTDNTGVWEQSCTNLPFGDGLNCSSSVQSPTEHHFTGKERDQESGNDYFGARYYASSMGRMLSPDPSQLYFANPAYPQSLNLYSYGRNNPLTNTDPTGMDCVNDTGNGTFTTNTGDCDNSTEAKANAGHYIDCDGCTTNSAGGTLDPTTGTMYLTDANGNGIAGTNISDWAAPQGTPATNVDVGGTSSDVWMSGYGLGGQLAYFPMAAMPGLPNGQLRAWNPPTKWQRFWMNVGCFAGQDADNMRPFGAQAGANDSTDNPAPVNGQRSLLGPNTDVKKGGTMPYNTSGTNSNAPDAAAGGASYLSNLGACLNNVRNQ